MTKRPKGELLHFFQDKEEKQPSVGLEPMSVVKDDFTRRKQQEDARTQTSEGGDRPTDRSKTDIIVVFTSVSDLLPLQ